MWGLGVLGFILMLSGCAAIGIKPGGHYIIKQGDTIQRVAQHYGVSVQTLAEWNNIQEQGQMEPGRRLYIPRGQVGRGRAPARARAVARGPSRHQSIQTFHGKFAWPLDGPVNSMFGMRHGRRHDGVDIGAKSGTVIRAAAAGQVVFDGRLSGYGKILIVRHPDQYYTAYAHNARHLVAKGEQVKQGEPIAKVGTTGRTTGPHLHFEIRHRQQARNPLFFLKARNAQERSVAARATGTAVGGGTVAVREHSPKAKWRKFTTRSPRETGQKVNKPFRARLR